MPLVRKLINVGNSRAVTIPPDWLKFYEDKTGVPITEVLMELNGEITIYIAPQIKITEKQADA
jgi:antitoxin component of MazEF toxin-antitoxin module